MTEVVAQRFADLSCGKIAYCHVEGDRPPVLLLHGNSSCGLVFAHQIEALRATGYGVIAPDFPGHGASDDAREPERTYSFPGYAAAMGELIDALGVTQVHVLGWSLGGHVALEIIGTNKRVLSALITGAPPVKPSPEALTAAFRPTPTMGLAGKERFSNEDAVAYATAMLGGTEHVTTALWQAVRRADGRARRLMIENGVAGVGLDEAALVATSEIPLAIVQGARDPFLDMDYLRGLRFANLWRGEIQWLPSQGHAPHWESPAAFNALMLAFLADVEA